MKKVLIMAAALFLGAFTLGAQDIVLSKADSVYIERTKVINDYSMIGVQYGVALSNVSFDPSRSTDMQFVPVNVGIMYTRYGKMFGYMPYFGLQAGVFYTKDAYKFSTGTNGVTDYILGASRAQIHNIEVPLLAHLHYDFWKMKIIVNVGPFVGYRLSVSRSDYHYGQNPDFMKYQFSFHPNEKRFDYGIKAGAGLGFVFDPIELHITAAYKYSLSNLHAPDVNRRTMEHDDKSKTYYNWSYPTNIIIAVGIHYQITNRIGLTKKQLRKQASSDVYEMYREAMGISETPGIEVRTEPEKRVEVERQAVPASEIEEQAMSGVKVNKIRQKRATKTIKQLESIEAKDKANEQ